MFQDFLHLLRFVLILIIPGLAVAPLTAKVFSGFKDKGYIFGKILGLYICGFVEWFLASCHILPFRTWSSWLSVLLVAAVSYGYVYYCRKKRKGFYGRSIVPQIPKNYYIIWEELAFILLLALACFVFAHRVPAFDTERSMDYGFMMSMSKTDFFPAKDMWCCNHNINYYYFGQYIFSFVQKLSLLPVGYVYTFGMYTILAYALVAVFVLVREISDSRIAGVISSAAVVCGGTCHFPVYKYIVPALWDILQIEGERPSYWFPDSTRFIGYNPEVANDHTIHEFPAYSFVIGDLHAHVINIMVVLCILALLWAWLRKLSSDVDRGWIKNTFNPYFTTIGFLIGISFMANSWDFLIYYVVSGSIILFGYLRFFNRNIKQCASNVAAAGAWIMILTLAVSTPFSVRFTSMFNGVAFASTHTRLYQFIIVWGFNIIVTALFVAMVLRRKKLTDSSLYMLLLSLCAVGLIILPEVVYIRDIYEASYPRANTMFKLTFEAFILFGICIGYIIVEFFRQAKLEESEFRKIIYRRRAVVILVISLFLSTYLFMSVKMWMQDNGGFEYVSMDAAYNIRELNSAEMNAIAALEKIAEEAGQEQPNVLEAYGDSYTNSCRVSTLTGFPTVLGWQTQEWLWRNSYDFIHTLATDIDSIYSGEKEALTKKLLDVYDIDYIFIGLKEYDKYEVVQNGILESMGDIVYQETCNDGRIIEIIKINQ